MRFVVADARNDDPHTELGSPLNPGCRHPRRIDMSSDSESPQSRRLQSSFALTAVMAATAFAIAGGIHYQTPALARMGAEFGADAATMGWIPTLSFGGMFAGIVLLVPLGDRMDKRRLILIKLWLLVAAQAVMAIAPSVTVLAIASFVTGVCSSLAQHLIAITAEVARPHERGKAVGTQLMALFIGILFSRIAGGLITTHLGWRASYVMSTVMLLSVVPLLLTWLPHTRPSTRVAYGALLRSTFGLLREYADLRRVAAIQFMLGICYGGFWAVVAPMLATFHRLGPTEAGLIGIPGAAGILVARPAGRLTDRIGATPVVTAAICCMLAAWATFSAAGLWFAAVVLGAILLDCALRGAMVANQTLVNTLLPDARGRANTIFGTHVWAGNATGAFLASTALAHYGWLAVCGVAFCAAGTALTVHLLGVRRRPAART